jgi:hypothetical protein
MDREINKTWLEPVLAAHLRPAEAPGELWTRIQRARKPVRSGMSVVRLGWVATAALLVAGASAMIRVHAASPGLSLQSTNAPQIQAWVKENTGLDVPLPARLSESVRLSGARVVANGVEVDYFVRSRPERLMIASADSSSSAGHRFVDRSTKKVSWSMGSQFYAVECATAEDSQAACLLCHS